MKRKIAAIFAADIAGYSRLIAEDEEETLRRLESYRAVTDDFIAKAGGRIFNTAGDAVLAEFPSAVEAVRCAIDIQESLRTRNRAYPPSRQMSFRIGITIGDVVERNGDLLGDGVNIAARLEGLAEVGGICISRAVHEQVANKLSVQFADMGAQEVKNIPTPVHAYMVAMRAEDGTYPQPKTRTGGPKNATAGQGWNWPAAATIMCIVITGTVGFLYFTKLKSAPEPNIALAPQPTPATPNTGPVAPSPPAPAPPASSNAPTQIGPNTTSPPALDIPPATASAPQVNCADLTGEVNELEPSHSSPFLKKNVFFIDAKPGCRITGVKHEIIKQANFSNLRFTVLEKGKKVRADFDLLAAATPAHVKLTFKASQEVLR
jgi:class 3 adenylate cyclase